MARQKPVERLDMDDGEIETLLEKASRAPLEADEIEKLRQLIETLKYITGELDKKRVSVKKLQALLFGDRSEKQSSPRLAKLLAELAKGKEDNTKDDEDQGEPQTAKRRKGHGRRKASDYQGGEQTHVAHPEVQHKDRCPKCDKGKLYKQKRPKIIVRLIGSAPITAKVWSYDWFRCNLCGYIVNAPLPPDAGPPEKYDDSVTSTIALLRYGYGMPLHRLEQMQQSVHIPLPAGTQWDLIDEAAKHLAPVFTELIRAAATGDVVYNDDTSARVLELFKENQALPKGSKERKGIFT
jgi:transposase